MTLDYENQIDLEIQLSEYENADEKTRDEHLAWAHQKLMWCHELLNGMKEIDDARESKKEVEIEGKKEET